MKTFLLNFIESKLSTRLLIVSFLLLITISVQGQNITQFTGGTNISADKAANATLPAYTTFGGNLVIAEVNKKDLQKGTLILSAPTGWTFNNTGVTVSGVTGSVAYTNSTTITITISGLSNGGTETVTVSGVAVRATEGANLPSSGNIVFGTGSTCVGADGNMVPGTTIFGALSQAIGTMAKLVVTLPGQTFTDASTLAGSGNSGSVTAQTVGTSFNITKLTATDQFFNVVTTFTGSKTIAYSGPGTSSGGSPTYTTTVSFTAGVSTTTLATSLRKAETTTITATNGGSFGTASSSLVVNPKALTISAPAVTSKIYDGTTAATITGTLSGILSGDTVTLNGTGTFSDKNVGVGKSVTSTSTLGGTDAANYSLTQPVGLTGTITTRSLTITANNGNKVYGTTQTTPVSGATTFGSTGLQNGETIGSVTLTYGSGALAPTDAVASTSTITPSAATGGTFTASNYAITYTSNSGTLTVITASLTITANNGSKTYGQTYTVGSGSTAFTPSGLQNGETIGSITIASTGAVNTAAVGSYSIVPTAATAGTFTASNYNITYTNGTLTVNAASLTITANNGSKTYGQTYTVGSGSTAFTSTALQNGETIGTITIASAGAVNTAAFGTYSIVPSAATSGTFTASNYSITYTNGTLTVNTASLTVTANNGSKTYGQTYTVGSGSTAFTPTGLQNGETIGSITIASTGAVNTAAAGSYNIVPSAATAGTFTASNYSITYTNGTLTVNTAALSITANNGSKTYGQTYTVGSGSTAFTSSGLQNSETIGSITIASTGAVNTAVVGAYSIVPSAATAGTFNPSNYTITYNNGTLTVNTAALTITANNASKCFGTTYALGTSAFTSTGLQNSETIGSVTLTSSGASSGAAVGSYSIVPSAATSGTFTASNYSITYTNGTLTVTALPSAPTGTNGSRCSTGTVSLSASVGGGETVDWYDASIGGTLLLSNSTSYTTPSISTTTVYYAEARNTTTGCVSSTRTAVTATVNPTTVGGSVIGGTTICSGSTSGLLTLSGNTGSVVRWEYSVSPFSSWTTIAATSTTYTSGALTQTTKFRAVVQSGVCSEANSSDTTVTVDPTAVGGTVASAQSICYGTEPADLTLSGNTGAVVKWQSSSDAGFSSPTDIVETSTTLSGTTIGALTANTYFRAVVQSGVCSSANSASVLITIDATTVGGTVSSNQTICSGSQPADLTLSGHVGSVIKWESSLDAGFSSPTDIIVASATLTGAAIGSLTQNTYFRAVVQSGACDPLESAYVLITVNTASIGGTVTGGTAICAGSTSDVLTLSGYTGTILRWESSVSPFSSWSTIANTVDTYTSGALTQTTRFRAVVQSGICSEVASAYTSVDINTTTWSSGAWNNGAPDTTKAAIITSAFISGGNDLEACSLTVNNSAAVSISSGDTVTLSGPLTVVAGSLVIFNNNANLIQSGSSNTNSGAIIIKRNSSALMRQDYTLWSSPVANQQLLAYSPQTLSNRFYTYNAATNLYDVVASPSTTNFATAQGYLIRMPNNHPATPTIWEGQFAGVPNNGDYSYTLTDGGAGNRFNLVGNPYPSPIDALAFISDTNNSSAITGTLYFWRKTNNALNPTYCTWTSGGFVGNGQAQVFDPNDVVQTGQGFFVEGTGTGTVNFNNTMRINDHANQFFKMSNTIERNRIWLNATNASGLFSQTMVGYITNATQGVDATIDGKYINDGGVALTSLIGTTPYAIQGRALPFDVSDVVPMNFKVAAAGDYTIAIDHVDGLFAGSQTVYLRDNTTGVIHDLTTGGYTFASEAGNFNTRFDILYQLPLGYSNPVFNANEVVIYKNPANEFVVNSGSAVMASIKVFDIRGRLLTEKKNINASQTTINTGLANEVLLVQVTAEDGVTVTKKVIK